MTVLSVGQKVRREFEGEVVSVDSRRAVVRDNTGTERTIYLNGYGEPKFGTVTVITPAEPANGTILVGQGRDVGREISVRKYGPDDWRTTGSTKARSWAWVREHIVRLDRAYNAGGTAITVQL